MVFRLRRLSYSNAGLLVPRLNEPTTHLCPLSPACRSGTYPGKHYIKCASSNHVGIYHMFAFLDDEDNNNNTPIARQPPRQPRQPPALQPPARHSNLPARHSNLPAHHSNLPTGLDKLVAQDPELLVLAARFNEVQEKCQPQRAVGFTGRLGRLLLSSATMKRGLRDRRERLTSKLLVNVRSKTTSTRATPSLQHPIRRRAVSAGLPRPLLPPTCPMTTTKKKKGSMKKADGMGKGKEKEREW
ncbi:hypothetical protein C8F01DRAFT_1083804 [Mycena amicta]|nr:hypothetical protein C8F01DRAFT_1083804 [Mycena amicta]